MAKWQQHFRNCYKPKARSQVAFSQRKSHLSMPSRSLRVFRKCSTSGSAKPVFAGSIPARPSNSQRPLRGSQQQVKFASLIALTHLPDSIPNILLPKFADHFAPPAHTQTMSVYPGHPPLSADRYSFGPCLSRSLVPSFSRSLGPCILVPLLPRSVVPYFPRSRCFYSPIPYSLFPASTPPPHMVL